MFESSVQKPLEDSYQEFSETNSTIIIDQSGISLNRKCSNNITILSNSSAELSAPGRTEAPIVIGCTLELLTVNYGDKDSKYILKFRKQNNQRT